MSTRVDEMLVAIERLAVTAGDERAAGDIATLIARRSRDGVETVPSSVPLAERVRSDDAMSRGSFVDAVERSLVAAGRRAGDILPGGLPPTWLGANFEVHGLPTSARASVSFALRWHGDRPALLWEQTGPPVMLTATAIDAEWRSDAPAGETLLAAPTQRFAPVDEPVSFT